MSTEGFARKSRFPSPQVPGGEINIQSPPSLPRPVSKNMITIILPMVMATAMIGMISLTFTSRGFDFNNPMAIMFPVMMVMSMVGMITNTLSNSGGKSTSEINEERKDYIRYLDNVREKILITGEKQYQILTDNHPAPNDLLAFIGSRQMWQRRPEDKDFGHVRLGLGSQRLATRIVPPETGPVEELEPVAAVALRRFVKAHSVLHNLPTAVSLRAFPAIGFSGPDEEVLANIRAIIMQVTIFHSPDELAIVVIINNIEDKKWSWLKWLPHVQNPTLVDGIGTERNIFSSLKEFETKWDIDLTTRGQFNRNNINVERKHLVVILDDGYISGQEKLLTGIGLEAVTLIEINPDLVNLSTRYGLPLEIRNQELYAKSARGSERFAVADQVSELQATVFARCMSKYRNATAAELIELTEIADSKTTSDFLSLIKIDDALQFDPKIMWRPRAARERLRVPIGLDSDGIPVELDIKEAAENGMGPHGLCIGATGSGKSEFLRTLVLALLSTHSPDALNLILVDFKGGATFLGLDSAPHVSAVITNLEEELELVDRMKDALSGEMNRRQELLRSSGNFPNVTEYEKARVNGADLAPLPALFIVVDEFSELLSQKPDFADLFVAIGRLGRSLHMHLLLASQRLEEGKLRGLDSHLSYRIGLKTFSANESRSVLGVPDAYHLPNEPGIGYLKTDASDLIKFKASYVSGEYQPARNAAQGDRSASIEVYEVKPQLFTAAPVPKQEIKTPLINPILNEFEEDESINSELASIIKVKGTKPNLLDVIVAKIEGHGNKAHKVWLPPLSLSPSVDQLLTATNTLNDGSKIGNLIMPIGLVDRPYEQRRDPLLIDISGAQGNVVVVGGPQSGKSTTLRSIIMTSAYSHLPEQIQFYCLDFGGGTLIGLQDLPHVGSVATRMDVDRVRRTVAEIVTIITDREARFQSLGIDSMREFRKRKAESLANKTATETEIIADSFGDVVLVVDGWSAIRGEFEFLEDQINFIATQGLSYGVHLLISAGRWAEIRPVVKDQIGTRIELRLGDPTESEVGRRIAQLVPVGKPGRGITAQGLHMLISLPRVDGSSDTDDLGQGVAKAVERLVRQYPSKKAPPVRMLPDVLERKTVLAVANELNTRKIVLGFNETALAPVYLNFDYQPHFLVLGDNECGKTTVLRNIIAGLIENSTPKENKILLVDYRRTMLGVVPEEFLAGYVTSAEALTAMLGQLSQVLKSRVPGSEVTQRELKNRSWWEGPDVFIVVDDYDLVATATANPVAIILEYLAQARDIGLHVIIARRSGGAARAMYEPVLARLKDLSVDGLIMSGSKEEGFLLGNIRASSMPAGRGNFFSRDKVELVQVSYFPPLD